MKITLIKQLNNTFKLAYDSDYDKAKKIKVGDLYECEIKKPRNYEFHKKFFALIDLVYQNQSHYNNAENLRKDLTISAGYYDERYNFNGECIIEAKSISFASMDNLEFKDFYSAVIDTIVKHFHFNRQDIIDNVEKYF